MYLRRTQRKNKDGTIVEYVQLAHNYRDPETKRPKPHIIYNFGRRDEIDEEGLRRLIQSIARFLGPADELGVEAAGRGDSVRFVESRPMGSAWLLRGVWNRLEIGKELAKLAKKRRFADPQGLAACILAMVANRALEPLSKHATPSWLEGDVYLPGGPDEVYDEQLYRSMDFLLEASEEIQKTVFFTTATLLNLEVDLLLYDTTSSYFEMDFDDEERAAREERWDAHAAGGGETPTRPRPQVVNDPPLRMQGHSKDHRPDLAQVVIGLAVTREGIPVRCWVFPGNTSDVETIAEVKRSLAGWKLNRVLWAVDRGMVSEDNLRELQKGGAHYVAGVKMRSGQREVEEALARPGRYKKVADNLEVKEVVVGSGEGRGRYVVIRNPVQAKRDEEDRRLKLARLQSELERLPSAAADHGKAVCRLIAHPTLGRYLTKDGKGRLVIDTSKVKAEERLDGKYLVRTSDDSLSAEDVALSYKQLAAVERAWRSMKTDLDLRPMYHRKADRIRAHVLLCWLALLLVRVIETRCKQTWPKVRQELDRLHRGVFECPSGTFVQRTELTTGQRQLFAALQVEPPPRFDAITPASKEVTVAAS